MKSNRGVVLLSTLVLSSSYLASPVALAQSETNAMADQTAADQAAATEQSAAVDVPKADILDMDLSSGTATDAARGTAVNTVGNPQIVQDEVLGAPVAKFDGDDAFNFHVGDVHDQLTDGFTVECTFYYDGALENQEQTLCGSVQGAGGYSLTFLDGQLTFKVSTHPRLLFRHIRNTLPVNKWYHMVGVFRGDNMDVYINGEHMGHSGAEGGYNSPKGADGFTVGAESAPNDGAEKFARATVLNSRIYSEPLSQEQAHQLYKNLENTLDINTEIVRSTPQQGQKLTEAVRFDIELGNRGLFEDEPKYTLDGKPIQIGDMIGGGLSAGEHVINISGTGSIGGNISKDLVFTSGNIPVDGGTNTDQKQDGTGVEISASATNPTGQDMQTTFKAAEVSTVSNAFQGTLKDFPASLNFAADGVETISDNLFPVDEQRTESPRAVDMPFQRFDLKLKDPQAESHDLMWTGSIDPKRAARLYAWNVKQQEWQELQSQRGSEKAETALTAKVGEDFVDAGTVHTMVLGYDVFADDMNEPVDNQFENPDDYDFSIVHHTDPQYIARGAERAATDEERKAYEKSYTDTMQWIADNADKRKIAYSANSGDLIQNWQRKPRDDEEQARSQFAIADRAQRILDESGVPNTVLAGNHDNLDGKDRGPNAIFNEKFGPDRYEALENTPGWQKRGTTYTPWKEGDNENSYTTFTESGMDFLILNLSYIVDEEEAAWAHQVLQEHPDHNAIIVTHAYNKPSTQPDGRGGTFSTDGKIITEKVINGNPNVVLVLSGHEHGVSIQTNKDVDTMNNHVTTLLADYQAYDIPAGDVGLDNVGKNNSNTPIQMGSSFLRLLQFDVDKGEVVVNTYSPFLDNFGATEYDVDHRYNGSEDEMRLPVQLSSRKTSFSTDSMIALSETDKVIGEAKPKSGEAAKTTWRGLEEGKVYGWYAFAEDSESKAVSRQFSAFTAHDSSVDAKAPNLVIPNTPLQVVAGTDVAKANLAEGIVATDDVDGDVTDSLQVVGKVDFNKPGNYPVTIVATDRSGNQALGNRIIQVVGKPSTAGSQDGSSSNKGSSTGSSSGGSTSGSSSIEGRSFGIGAALGIFGVLGAIAGLLFQFFPQLQKFLGR